MSIPRYSAENFRDALLKLLPPGSLWNHASNGSIGRLFLLLGRVFQRNNNRTANLIRNLSPATTESFLSEWEKTLGLPDSCMVGKPIQEQRRNAIIAKLTDEGGSSVDYYLNIAKQVGINALITEFAPARAGVLKAGQRCGGRGWASTWQVTLPKTSVLRFRAGRSAAGEPLQKWQTGYLECVILKRIPAHTHVIFNYRVS